MSGFSDPIIGPDGTLVYPAIQSPDFNEQAGTGWRIAKDGSAYFYDVILPGGQGVSVFFSAGEPATTHIGDLWYNIAQGMLLSQLTAAGWTPYQIGTGAIANAAVTPALIASLTASLIGPVGVLNPNPYFTGGDMTGWATTAGALTVTDNPPGGARYPWALEYVNNGAAAVVDENAAAEAAYRFAAFPGEQYVVTTWVYSTGTTVQLGFGWYTPGGNFISEAEQPFAVVAGQWTKLTVVQTAPGGTGTGYPRFASSGDSATWYIAGCEVRPQVPGQLLQAASVGAAQLAAGAAVGNLSAGDITADLLAAGAALANVGAGGITEGYIAAGAVVASALAAGIVYAGIVDGTTITGATFVADGTSGEILIYSGPPAAGNLVASVSGAAGTDAHGNAYPPGFAAFYGGSYVGLFADSSSAGYAYWSLSAAKKTTDDPSVGASVTNAGAANEYLTLLLDSGNSNGERSAYIAVQGEPADASASEQVQVVLGNGTVFPLTITRAATVIDKSTPLAAGNGGTAYGWQPMTLESGWTVGSGGVARYKLMPDNTVMVQLNNVVPGTTGDGTAIWAYPSGYAPPSEQKFNLIATYSAAPAYGSMPFAYTASGALEVYDLRGTVSGIHGSFSYALD